MSLRSPGPQDAALLWRLVRDSGALDLNSPYCYLLVCSHFADTSLVAERNGSIVGFVAAYRPPTRPGAIFVWQIAVAASQRGAGLARRLLDTLVDRPAVRDAEELEATVTASNEASRRLFGGFARRLGVACREERGFAADLFPDGPDAHEAEILLRIGPLDRTKPVRGVENRTDGG
ncbi:MAG: diaminobutyrate acetyltransferase [Myxococcota bacterium]|nr:diaminobutyrate acetyltransferase [Myxococcota bacterium]